MKKAVLAAAVVLTSTMAFAQNPEGARGGAAAGAATGAVGGAIVGGPVGAVVGGVGGAVVGGIAGDDTPRFKTYVQAHEVPSYLAALLHSPGQVPRLKLDLVRVHLDHDNQAWR